MYEVYNAFFQKRLPRVLPQMKEMLQFSPEKRTGDWFLLEQGTVIILYGFLYHPYILPAFLTVGVFSLELIRQKLVVENEHFLNFKKSSEIKFPWVVGPFIIKNGSYLPMMEILLR